MKFTEPWDKAKSVSIDLTRRSSEMKEKHSSYASESKRKESSRIALLEGFEVKIAESKLSPSTEAFIANILSSDFLKMEEVLLLVKTFPISTPVACDIEVKTFFKDDDAKRICSRNLAKPPGDAPTGNCDFVCDGGQCVTK